MEEMKDHCERFAQQNAGPLFGYWQQGYTLRDAGSDLAYTRNGHGTGFWDRKHSDGPGSRAFTALADAARSWGTADLWIPDTEDPTTWIYEDLDG